MFLEIIKNFMCQKVPHQPQVVGLSALLFVANNQLHAEKNFKKVLKNFPTAAICFPKLDFNQQKTKQELVSLSEDQQLFIKVAVNRTNTHLEKSSKFYNRQHQTIQLKMDLSNRDMIIRDLRSMQRQSPEKENNRLIA